MDPEDLNQAEGCHDGPPLDVTKDEDPDDGQEAAL